MRESCTIQFQMKFMCRVAWKIQKLHYIISKQGVVMLVEYMTELVQKKDH